MNLKFFKKITFLEYTAWKYDILVSRCFVVFSLFLEKLKRYLPDIKSIIKRPKFDQKEFERKTKEWSEKSYAHNRKLFVQIISRINKKELLSYCAASFFIPSNRENLAVIEYVAANSLFYSVENKGSRLTPHLFYRLCRIAFKIQLAEVWKIGKPEKEVFSAHIENLILRGTGRRPDQSIKSALYRFDIHNKWLEEHLGFSIKDAIKITDEIVNLITAQLNEFFGFYKIISDKDLEKIGLVFDQFGVLKAPHRKAVKMMKKALIIDSFISQFSNQNKIKAFIARHSSLGYSEQVSFGDEISLYDRPIVKIEKQFFLPFTSLLVEGLPEIYYKDLRADTGYWEKEGDKKGKAAENRITEMLSDVFPKDFIFSNPLVKKGSELIDNLVIFEDTAIIVESKSRYLSREARKKPEIIKKYIAETIAKGLNQTVNAEKILQSGKIKKLVNSRGHKIDISKRKINRYLTILILDERLSLMVTSDFLHKNKKVYNNLPLVVDINDLEYITEEFDTPREFIKYLLDRQEFLASGKYNTADELNLLGYYKISGRNFPPVADEEKVDRIVLDQFWEAYQEDYGELNIEKTKKDEVSYFVDHLIERAHEAGERSIMVAEELSKLTRVERRSLGEEALKKSFKSATDGKPHFCLMKFKSVDYGLVFLFTPEDRIKRAERLKTLARLALYKLEISKIVAFASEPANVSITTFDYGIIEQPYEKNEEMIKIADKFFGAKQETSSSEYEGIKKYKSP